MKRVRSVLFRIEVVREGQEAVSAIWYEPDGYNGEDKLLVFVYIHGDAWISTDADIYRILRTEHLVRLWKERLTAKQNSAAVKTAALLSLTYWRHLSRVPS